MTWGHKSVSFLCVLNYSKQDSQIFTSSHNVKKTIFSGLLIYTGRMALQTMTLTSVGVEKFVFKLHALKRPQVHSTMICKGVWIINPFSS